MDPDDIKKAALAIYITKVTRVYSMKQCEVMQDTVVVAVRHCLGSQKGFNAGNCNLSF